MSFVQEEESPAPSPAPVAASASTSGPLLTLPSMDITPQRAVILAILAGGIYQRKVLMSDRKYALSFAALLGVLVYNERRGAESYCSACRK